MVFLEKADSLAIPEILDSQDSLGIQAFLAFPGSRVLVAILAILVLADFLVNPVLAVIRANLDIAGFLESVGSLGTQEFLVFLELQDFLEIQEFRATQESQDFLDTQERLAGQEYLDSLEHQESLAFRELVVFLEIRAYQDFLATPEFLVILGYRVTPEFPDSLEILEHLAGLASPDSLAPLAFPDTQESPGTQGSAGTLERQVFLVQRPQRSRWPRLPARLHTQHWSRERPEISRFIPIQILLTMPPLTHLHQA